MRKMREKRKRRKMREKRERKEWRKKRERKEWRKRKKRRKLAGVSGVIGIIRACAVTNN